MRPTTVRRMLVLGVCALGVSALYLVPGLAQAPHRTSERAVDDSTPPGTTGEGTPVEATRPPVSRSIDSQNGRTGDGRVSGRGGRATEGATAFTRDVNSPTAITALRTERTRDRLVVRWSAAHDDVAVTSYVVQLNGFQVAETTRESVSLRWFKGAGRQQIVQVRALDAAGNLSEPAALLVDRPEPGETPAPDPEPQPADPTTAPPDESPGPEPTTAPTAEPTAGGSASAGGGVPTAPQQSTAADPSASGSSRTTADTTQEGTTEDTTGDAAADESGSGATTGGPSS